MRKFILLTLALNLSACGTTGTINAPLLDEPVPKNEARLIITRDNSTRYFGASADVSLDGRRIGSLARQASVVENIATGRHTVSVTTTGDVGRYSQTFDAKAGKTYTFEVGPNKSKSGLSTALFGYLGDAVAAGSKENTGYFQIVPASN